MFRQPVIKSVFLITSVLGQVSADIQICMANLQSQSDRILLPLCMFSPMFPYLKTRVRCTRVGVGR